MKGAQAKANLRKLGLAGLPELIQNISDTMVGLQNNMSKTEKDFKDFTRTLSKQNETTEEGSKKVNKYGKEVNSMGIAITKANKRTSILNSALKKLSAYDKPKTFELFSPKSFKAYIDAGGSGFEYFAEFLTNSREDIRIMSFEAAKLRRFVFGFIPGGFTFLSKIGFTLQFIGSTLRTFLPRTAKDLKENTDEMGKFQKAIGGVFGFLGGKRGKDAFKNPIKGMSAFIKKRKQVNKLADNSNTDKLAFSNFSLDTAKDSNVKMRSPVGTTELEGIKKFGKQSTIMKLAQRKIDKRIAKEQKVAFKKQISNRKRLAKLRLDGEKKYGEEIKELNEKLRKIETKAEQKAIAFAEKKRKEGAISTFDEEVELINKKRKELIKGAMEDPRGKKIARDKTRAISRREKMRSKYDAREADMDKVGKEKGLTAKHFEKISFKVNAKRMTKLLNSKPIKLFRKVGSAIFMISRKVGYFFLGFLAFVVGMFLLLKLIGPALKASFDAIKTVFLFGLSMILPAISTIWEGLKGLWNVAFNGGSLTDLINSLVTLAYGILQLVLGVAIATLGVVITLAVSTLFNAGKKIGEKLIEVAQKGKTALAAAAVIGFILWWYTAPVWLVALIGFVVYKAVRILIKDGVDGLKDAVLKVKVLEKVSKGLGKVKDKVTGLFEKRATGGIVGQGETTLVGERGPELVKLPAGSRVYTNSQSRQMSGSTVNNFNITVNAKDTSKEEMRRMADEIGKMVSYKINRRSSFRNSIL